MRTPFNRKEFKRIAEVFPCTFCGKITKDSIGVVFFANGHSTRIHRKCLRDARFALATERATRVAEQIQQARKS